LQDGSFVFRNVFFYLYWENDTSTSPSSNGGNGSSNYLLTTSKIRRTAKPNRKGQRSKYVVKPEAVAMAGNHVVWKLMRGEGRLG
jgi:hypothetical protein